MDADWVSAIANVVVAGGVFIGVSQLFAAKKQVVLLADQLRASNEQTALQMKNLVADHERSRRERAVELIQMWAIRLNRKASLARKLIESLSEEQVRAIWNQEQLKLDKKHLETIKGCLSENFFLNASGVSTVNDEYVTLQEKDSAEIRWLIVSYLNLLESILVAWHNGVADRQIIEAQFRYLVAPEKGHFILERFRQCAGGTNAYPAIYAFTDEIRSRNPAPSGKEEIIHAA